MSISPRYRDLVSLFPRFLGLQPFGWKGSQDIVQSGLQLPALLLLRALVLETDRGEPLSRQEMEGRTFNPYSTFHPIFDNLPSLLEKGYLLYSDSLYLVTPQGRTLIERIEQTVQDYTATLTPLSLPELTRLAALLEEIAQRMWKASEPAVKAHQARCHRLPLITTSSPMVHLDAAIFALWMARDDAHIAAWQAEGLSGPYLDVLTYLWTEEAHTFPELTTTLRQSQRPEDILQGVMVLNETGYLLAEEEQLTLTEYGQQVRTHIEEETDRIYFTPWPSLTPEDLNWLYSCLKKVCDILSARSSIRRCLAPQAASYATPPRAWASLLRSITWAAASFRRASLRGPNPGNLRMRC